VSSVTVWLGAAGRSWFGNTGHGTAGLVKAVVARCVEISFGSARSGVAVKLTAIKGGKDMAGFPKKERQRIIDEYLAATGRNMFHPAEFIDWLKDQPEHEAYEWFYGMEDEHAARQWRIQLARQMASGLRIVVKHTEPTQQKINLVVREYPAFVSPASNRKNGGGYEAFDPDNEQAQQELRRQAAVGLASWLNRYRGCAENIGVDVSSIEDIAEILRGKKEDAA